MRYQDFLHERTTASIPVPYLYHATRAANLETIRAEGLLTRFYGAVHGGMDLHPPKPSLYLSRKPRSDNLHTALFDGLVVVLKIDTRHLDANEMWPDDMIYDLWADEEVLTTPASVAKALGITRQEASEVLETMAQTADAALPLVMKPFWRWYLMWRKGGEVAYTADIPPEAIIDVQPF